MPGDKGELKLTVHHRSDTGRVRDHNEDYLGYRQPKDPEMRAEAGWLYVVADGVGGAQAGEVASKLAVQTVLTAYYRAYQETPAERLIAAFAEANHAIYDQAGRQESPHRMSTTLVAAALHGRELTVANVGDSRAYLIHRGQIQQITHDHSMVARLIDEGVITPEQAESHPRRHVLSRSIGAHPHVEADLFTETIQPGDRLLLCTDGLTEYVADAEILATVQANDPETSVQRLVELANERGGKDNITVLFVRALGEREERLPPLTLPQKAAEGPVLSSAEGPALSSAEGPSPWRSSWLRMGAILLCLLICAAGLAAGAFLLKPTPTPTPTTTTTPLPSFADATASATATQTPTSLPTATDTVLPTETTNLVSIEPPAASDTPPPTHTKTASPAPTQTPLTPTDTALPRLTETATLTPTATSTSEISVLPTPTDTLSPTPTPTGTTESSPLPTPRP